MVSERLEFATYLWGVPLLLRCAKTKESRLSAFSDKDAMPVEFCTSGVRDVAG